MEIGAALIRTWELRWRNRGGRLAPFLIVMIVHLLLLAMIISWAPPPMGQVASAIEVSLISGTGLITLASPPLAPPAPPAPPAPKLDPLPPKATPSAAKSSVPTTVAVTPGSLLVIKPKVELTSAKTLTQMMVDLTSGGPSLTTQPLSIASQPPQAPSALMQTARGKDCQILENLKSSLQGSDTVKSALLRIPSQSLSVAKAIVLWDDRWIDASSVGGSSVLEPIEQAVVQIVSQAPPSCQDEGLKGVRFITLGDAHDTIVLAFGSNDWHWRDVLATLSPTISK